MSDRSTAWPALPLASWQDTYETLHMWLQVVGKIRMARTPHVNHWWEVPLYVTSRGLTTSPIPYGTRTFELTFDFLEHALRIETSDGRRDVLPLVPMTVADFYADLMTRLRRLDLDVTIRPIPCEIPSPIPFAEDRVHRSYDADAAARWWRAVVQTDRVFKEFRARFHGKASPVHLFWGAFDLAVTRFSGRQAPAREWPQLAAVMRDAYSHEVISAGFWPGGWGIDEPAYYAYAVPEPPGFKDAVVKPAAARYEASLGEFVLPYDAVRTSASPDETLLDFLQTTYEAGANLGHWDRQALEG
ncbi:MAG TPA: DUF5996 family protein [Vicinamibacterales bacterium]|nr:DUF5996 family protein [Vicinamibacterales bacterium]